MPIPLLTKTEIREWAEKEFHNAFQALPDIEQFHFESLDNDLPLFNLNGTSLWPSGIVGILLPIGRGHFIARNSKPTILYAFVHGNNRNRVGYLCKAPGGQYYSQISPELVAKGRHHFFDKFAKLRAGSESSVLMSRWFRAMVCYAFLLAGFVKKVGGYATFRQDFKTACQGIARRLGRNVPLPRASNLNSERVQPQEAMDPQMRGSTITSNLNGGHTGRNDNGPDTNQLFRSAHGQMQDIFDRLEHDNARLLMTLKATQTKNNELQTRITTLTSEHGALQQELAIQTNVSNKKDQEIQSARKLAEQVIADATRCDSLKQEAQMWKSRAEKAENETKGVKREYQEFLEEMSESAAKRARLNSE